MYKYFIMIRNFDIVLVNKTVTDFIQCFTIYGYNWFLYWILRHCMAFMFMSSNLENAANHDSWKIN